MRSEIATSEDMHNIRGVLAFHYKQFYNRIMSLSQPLYALQQVDLKLSRSKSRLIEIEKALSQNIEVQKAQKTFNAAEKKVIAAKKELKNAEIDVEKQAIKISQNSKKTYSGTVTDPKVLEDLQQEAISLAKHLETLEEIQLDKMLNLDDLETILQKAEDVLNSAKDKSARENSMLMAEKTNLINEAENLIQTRLQMVPKIDGELLAMYTTIAAKKNGVAVTTLKQDMCGACGVKLTSNVFQESKSPNKITKCTTCKRILHTG
jgi:uncharacterized protein